MPIDVETIIPIWLIFVVVGLLTFNSILNWWLLFERRRYRKLLEKNPAIFDLYNEGKSPVKQAGA